jgi:hypothetical protein
VAATSRTRLILCLTAFVVLWADGAAAQSNSELYRSGQIGYANGNCVKAARFWFAYLIRQPPELETDLARKEKIERVIRECDEAPLRFAETYVQYQMRRPTKEGKCRIYAELAVAQFEASQLAGCNVRGGLWSPDFAYHYNWCVTADDGSAYRSRGARMTALNSCAPQL